MRNDVPSYESRTVRDFNRQALASIAEARRAISKCYPNTDHYSTKGGFLHDRQAHSSADGMLIAASSRIEDILKQWEELVVFPGDSLE